MTALDDARQALEAAGYTVTPPAPAPWDSLLEVWPRGRRDLADVQRYETHQEALDAFDAVTAVGMSASLTHVPPGGGD